VPRKLAAQGELGLRTPGEKGRSRARSARDAVGPGSGLPLAGRSLELRCISGDAFPDGRSCRHRSSWSLLWNNPPARGDFQRSSTVIPEPLDSAPAAIPDRLRLRRARRAVCANYFATSARARREKARGWHAVCYSASEYDSPPRQARPRKQEVQPWFSYPRFALDRSWRKTCWS
jgi:hypothetical protein